MTVVLLPMIALGVIGAIILTLRITPDQTITCPHCGLEFTTDLYTFHDHALVSCRYCRRWMHAHSIRGTYYAEKLK
jgi:uncharacterized Zn-finger protein